MQSGEVECVKGTGKRGARVNNWGKVKCAKFCAQKPTSEAFICTIHAQAPYKGRLGARNNLATADKGRWAPYRGAGARLMQQSY